MNYSYLAKLATKFVVRGFILKGAKRMAVKGGRFGISAASIAAGGYFAYSLFQDYKRKQELQEGYENS